MLQQRQLDSLKVKNSISAFSTSVQKIRDELDVDIPEATVPSKRQCFIDGNKQMAKEVCEVIITNVCNRFFSSDFLEASFLNLIASKNTANHFPTNMI